MSVIGKLQSTLNTLAHARDALKIGWSLPPARTTAQWMDVYHKSPMLDPLHMIASDFASADYKLFDRAQYKKDPQDAEPLGSHAIYDLIDHPMPDHPEIDRYAFLYLTSVYHRLVGDAFWLVDRDNRGQPCGLYIIPPTWMIFTPSEPIPYFRIQPMGNTSHRYFNADPADVVWFKAPDVNNPYGRGRARGEALGDEIETHEFSSKYAKNFFYNDAVPPVIFEIPGISDPDAKKFKEDWISKFGGFLNAHKLSIVAKKDFKVHQLTTSPKEMDFVESRKYLIQMANEHDCVPPEMRGNLQNSNRATIDSAFYLWSKNVVTKELKLFASCLNNQFVPMFDKSLVWVYDNIVPEDNAAKMLIANDGFKAGALTRNEWRAIATSCGVKLAPDEARGDVYLTGMMVQEVPAFKKDAPEPAAQNAPIDDSDKPVAEPAPKEPIAAPTEDEDKAIDLDLAIKELIASTKALKYDEDQPRDENGRFGSGGEVSSTDNSESGELSNSEQTALDTYAGTDYGTINEQLRKGTTTPETEKIVGALDSAIDKQSNWNGTVYRGGDDSLTKAVLDNAGVNLYKADGSINQSTLNRMIDKPEYLSDKLADASPFTDKGFVSTTTKKDVTDSFTSTGKINTVLELSVKGKSLDVSSNVTSDEYNQSERLFARNSTFRLYSGAIQKSDEGYTLYLKGRINA
jgi:HK97 family phage portal protein